MAIQSCESWKPLECVPRAHEAVMLVVLQRRDLHRGRSLDLHEPEHKSNLGVSSICLAVGELLKVRFWRWRLASKVRVRKA